MNYIYRSVDSVVVPSQDVATYFEATKRERVQLNGFDSLGMDEKGRKKRKSAIR